MNRDKSRRDDQDLGGKVLRAWMEEAQRRDRAIDDGTESAIPADEVFQSLFDRWKERPQPD
ncbi:MAG TPA: addiction module protein [Thermoanaerobaculia bacterium]|nr:addiction module protein [Thermoanaerobaculia bacterium]